MQNPMARTSPRDSRGDERPYLNLSGMSAGESGDGASALEEG